MPNKLLEIEYGMIRGDTTKQREAKEIDKVC